MPIVINELVIKGTVAAESHPTGAATGQKSRTAENDRALVEACVEAVMRVLEKQKER